MNIFTNAKEMAQKHPETFERPSPEELAKVTKGDIVKVCNGPERFWTIVKSIEKGAIKATVNNDLIDKSKYDYGDEIEFNIDNIYSIYQGH